MELAPPCCPEEVVNFDVGGGRPLSYSNLAINISCRDPVKNRLTNLLAIDTPLGVGIY
jgi:hypothetical protein